VCCQANGGTCQAQSSCGMRGNRQICTSSTECPTAYPNCTGFGGQMTCRVAADAGAPSDAGGATDSGAPADAAQGG
jgi:hypothetical protein